MILTIPLGMTKGSDSVLDYSCPWIRTSLMFSLIGKFKDSIHLGGSFLLETKALSLSPAEQMVF
jgi:hypothetical protein